MIDGEQNHKPLGSWENYPLVEGDGYALKVTSPEGSWEITCQQIFELVEKIFLNKELELISWEIGPASPKKK